MTRHFFGVDSYFSEKVFGYEYLSLYFRLTLHSFSQINPSAYCIYLPPKLQRLVLHTYQNTSLM